ncbi:MAG: PolC-type DNA polymerase III [Clostridiales bacterium]|nr:PolC-type DNA polymerase III [Clostridiales bacterium]
MSAEFKSILLQAGAWADGLALKHVNWNKESGALDIHLTSPQLLRVEQRESLGALLTQKFPSMRVRLTIESAAAPELAKEKPADQPKKRTPAIRHKQPSGQPAARPLWQSSGQMPAAADKPLFGKRIAQAQVTPMREINELSGRVTVEGRPLAAEYRVLGKGSERCVFLLTVTDFTNTMQCKAFMDKKEAAALERETQKRIQGNGFLRIRGECEYDKFARDVIIRMDGMTHVNGEERRDTADVKRVELHLHTQMSAMDALTNVAQAVERAASWGHTAIAVTDHGVVQAFPEAAKAGQKHGIKVLFGMEGYLTADTEFLPMDQTYVVFDIETTGLRAEQGHIIEIGAVKLKNDKIIDTFSTFVNAGVPIPPHITGLTGIRDDMIEGAPLTRDALGAFFAFSAGCVLVAHNAVFDVGFIRHHGALYNITFDNAYADTLMLSRYLLFHMQNHKLHTVCERLGVALINHHRAVDDAKATAQVFQAFMGMMRGMGMREIAVTTGKTEERNKGKRIKRYHVVLLAQTQQGLKNLYRMVSIAHLDFFHNKRPEIPKSLLQLYREGLFVGSACVYGEVFQGMLQGGADEELLPLAGWYDYLEVQPIANNAHLMRNNIVADEEGLRDLNRRMVRLAQTLQKPVVATGDVHFLEPEDAIFRAILLTQEGYEDAREQAPLYLKTTDEMLAEFAYLGEETAYETVIKAPNAIAARCEALRPYPGGTFAPGLDHAEEDLERMALYRAHTLYGQTLPSPVRRRMDKELRSIVGNGFASLYLIAQKLVEKSMNDGYLVGSRGSVGSSLVATMLGITEVNPLAPHYVCHNCAHSDFDVDRTKYACGVDMPDAICPHCGGSYTKQGYDILFEVFLGFEGDKTPDIDLNFSGEYQQAAHKFSEEILGNGHAFRAGTISSVKQKTAYGYVMKYLEKHGISVSKLEVDRLCGGCSGVKRTTGQHPGGIVFVPKDNDILNFTPVQYPSDQRGKGTITTHFDFHALDDRLVKLDILGHVDPTALRMLQDITGVDPRGIPLGDPDTLSLYKNTERLGADVSALGGCDVGSLGLPEFGTSFVRQMLRDTRPTTMEELVRIAGLSHGTDVWVNNAQDLIKNGVATLSEVICTRDDIMNYLIGNGCDPSISFQTMESVRKGRGLTDAMRAEMRMHGVPDWYIESCEKIKYMFPRAHAVAYVMMSFRVAYYKMHHPRAFYAVYYTVRADTFDVRKSIGGAENVLKELKALRDKGKDASDVDNDLVTILEVVYEMNMRGIALLPVDIYKSHATRFLVEEEGIRAPFSALAGIGKLVAEGIAANITGEKFLSIEDFQLRTGANSAAVAALEEVGCFNGFPRTNQISMF